jgi:UDP-N-acetylglucosamine 1-carboxyvinyltransferase
MPSFEVTGGKKLKGEITPQGAKNEALQIISAVLLTPKRLPSPTFRTSST